MREREKYCLLIVDPVSCLPVSCLPVPLPRAGLGSALMLNRVRAGRAAWEMEMPVKTPQLHAPTPHKPPFPMAVARAVKGD